MTLKSNINPQVLLFAILLMLTGVLLGQSRVELIHSAVSKGRIENGSEIKILEGAVHVRQDSVEIFCERAIYYRADGKLVLTQNVKLVQGMQVLTAEKVTYYEEQQLAIAEENVVLTRPGRQMHSEYLEYYYESDRSYARTDLVLIDEKSRVRVTALEGEYLPEEQVARVNGNAHFQQVAANLVDTLNIYAKRMNYHFDPQRQARAVDSVRIVRGTMSAKCDSAIYLLDEDRAYLEINPIAHQQNNELHGSQMELVMLDTEIKEIRLKGKAEAISVEDSAASKVNRLIGREIIGYIDNQQIDRLWAIDNARSLYFIKDGDDEQGINRASADTIKIEFVDGQVDRIGVIGGSKGTFFPQEYGGNVDIND